MERKAEEPVVLFAAALFRLKNAHTLLRAIGRLKRAGVPGRLHLAGSAIDAGYERQLRTLVNEENIEDRVKFLGLLDRPALWRD
jgi:glycosyltransferase involved in cell wall biosynthesis